MRERPPWQSDPELVRELIGTFPFEDTTDQAEVDEKIASDLASAHPMDRLLCGDVGFGKTELAVRAAFRVVSAGGQAAVLVPTTILAQQHAQVFRDRFATFPVEVEMVSRYVPEARVREILERTAAGRVDVLIGTHRLLSKDVEFARLGLVVIDEEQRFGVQHKEHFKKLRAQVDVLTLTATPIPRTLHMSLAGIRDIAALTVPPPGRQSIETVLGWKEDDAMIREALLREKQREGQTFFMHNRVASIHGRARQLARLVPECSFAVGHGQMSAAELRGVMDAFTRGEVDVLVATTIVENGIDIPSAGTILIDDADRFGLSELHQLRGRVGRGSAKAWCHLLIERGKPIPDVARQRLKALEEMNQLGAGFGISIKDLELRGAGNILGAEQSGHIAAVGYDMYCRLLKSTVERMQAGEGDGIGEEHDEELSGGAELVLGVRAFLPDDWIPDQDVRIELLREVAQIHGPEDAERMAQMLRDRFGRLPEETSTFLRVLALKATLDAHEIRRLLWLPEAYVIEYPDPVALERLLAGKDVELRRVRSGVAHLVLPKSLSDSRAAFEWLEELLMQRPVG
jgi:transcription-repair coupling factor (superfamily II helicase)